MKTYFLPSLHLVLPPHPQSASDLSEFSCALLHFPSSALPWTSLSRTCINDMQNFMNSELFSPQLQSSSSSFIYLFKSHLLTAAIALCFSLKIQSFSLWPPVHSYVHLLFLSCIVDWGLMVMMMLIITMAAMAIIYWVCIISQALWWITDIQNFLLISQIPIRPNLELRKLWLEKVLF